MHILRTANVRRISMSHMGIVAVRVGLNGLCPIMKVNKNESIIYFVDVTLRK